MWFYFCLVVSKCLTLLIEISPINNTKVLKAVDCRVKVQVLVCVVLATFMQVLLQSQADIAVMERWSLRCMGAIDSLFYKLADTALASISVSFSYSLNLFYSAFSVVSFLQQRNIIVSIIITLLWLSPSHTHFTVCFSPCVAKPQA